MFHLDESPGYLAYLAHKAYDELGAKTIKHLDINPNQWFILDQVFNHEGATQKELAEICSRDPSAILRTLDVMEKKNLIVRKNEENNRRLKRIYITEKGKKIRLKILPIVEENMKIALAGFEEEEAKLFKEFFFRMIENLQKQL